MHLTQLIELEVLVEFGCQGLIQEYIFSQQINPIANVRSGLTNI